MIGTLLVAGTAVGALGIYLKRKLFPKLDAAQTISKARGEIDQVVAENSRKIEYAIAGELDMLSSTAGVAIRRAKALADTGALHKDVTDGLNKAGTALADAVDAVETALGAKKLHNV